MLKNITYYLEWEKLVKNEYSVKVFNAAKKKVIKKFSEYNVAPDNAIYWVPEFEKAILDKISEHKNCRVQHNPNYTLQLKLRNN